MATQGHDPHVTSASARSDWLSVRPRKVENPPRSNNSSAYQAKGLRRTNRSQFFCNGTRLPESCGGSKRRRQNPRTRSFAQIAGNELSAAPSASAKRNSWASLSTPHFGEYASSYSSTELPSF